MGWSNCSTFDDDEYYRSGRFHHHRQNQHHLLTIFVLQYKTLVLTVAHWSLMIKVSPSSRLCLSLILFSWLVSFSFLVWQCQLLSASFGSLELFSYLTFVLWYKTLVLTVVHWSLMIRVSPPSRLCLSLILFSRFVFLASCFGNTNYCLLCFAI